MKLYDNDAYREDFMAVVYSLLSDDGINDRANQIIDTFDSVPAVEAEPVVHGRWESHLMPLAYKCSACGYKPSAKEWRFHKRNYCPNCGARMDKEDADEKTNN